jgi:Ca2+-binding EF-hand superfamily protein
LVFFIKKVDTNKDDKWSFSEAINFFPKLDKKLREKIDSTRLKEMFETFDVNKDHLIDREEFKRGLNEKLRSSIKHKRETDIVGGDTF